jgi:hypothetical protein
MRNTHKIFIRKPEMKEMEVTIGDMQAQMGGK